MDHIENTKIKIQKSLNKRDPVQIPEHTFATNEGLRDRSEGESKKRETMKNYR